MNERRPAFTVAEGIKFQSRDLLKWKMVLSSTAYARLEQHAQKENDKLTDVNSGYDVFRGQDLDNFMYRLMNEFSKEYESSMQKASE